MPTTKSMLTTAAIVLVVRFAEELLANLSPMFTVNALADMIISPAAAEVAS